MSRILAIDYGTKRVGIAISDPLQILAKEYDILKNENLVDLIIQIKSIIKKEDVNLILLGLPLNMNATEGFQAQIVRDFGNLLQANIDIDLIYVDERQSSKQAKAVLKQLKVSEKQMRHNLDAKAACMFLQDYLDYH